MVAHLFLVPIGFFQGLQGALDLRQHLMNSACKISPDDRFDSIECLTGHGTPGALFYDQFALAGLPRQGKVRMFSLFKSRLSSGFWPSNYLAAGPFLKSGHRFSQSRS